MRVWACLVALHLLCFSYYADGQALPNVNSQTVNSLLGNSGFVQRQLRCVLGKGACDSTGNTIKAAIPEVIGRQCRSCNPSQSRNARKIISFIQQNYPSEWREIQTRYQG